MSSELDASQPVVIDIDQVTKCFDLYSKPSDRLRQFVWPRVQSALGIPKKRYHEEFWALKGVSLQVRAGETIGVIGRNGCGKSTLLQLLCQTLMPTSGGVQVRGKVAALLELGSGFNPEFTGRENVFFNAGVLGQKRQTTEAKLAAIEAFADIGSFIDQPVKTYSSGMLVRLAFSVIAHVDADILVIDEALAVGDAAFTQKCMRYLRDFMRTKTVVFVSHDLGAVQNLCHRVLWLEAGVPRFLGDAKTACERYLESMFGTSASKKAALAYEAELAEPPLREDDCRTNFFAPAGFTNELSVLPPQPDSGQFTSGQAEITRVAFSDTSGNTIAHMLGGERVLLTIEVLAKAPIDSPIVGFFLKDRLGQNLWGDNTWITHRLDQLACRGGDRLVAEFEFVMPRLAVGDYSITASIASGTQDDFVQHHWIHDALFFRSQTPWVAGGLVGIPMQRVALRIDEAQG